MTEQLQQIEHDFLTQLESAHTQEALDQLAHAFFSRKAGAMTQVMKGLKDLSIEEKKAIGQAANALKTKLLAAFEAKQAEINAAQLVAIERDEKIDVTEAIDAEDGRGHVHPMTIVEQELTTLFRSMGFRVLDGPELESDFYNFTALNFSDDHPARDSHDTFFIKDHPEWLMRTHTSPVQVRAMQAFGAPLRTIVPGRCFRNEAVDASHEHTFYQLEGLVVDRNIAISDLIGVMKGLLKGMLKKDVDVRLRPGYFPFVEPAFELDMRCLLCDGKGCGACKHAGWIEMIPCGLVHPRVIEAGGLDSNEWSGFAFGLGSMRLAMQRFGIEDIRHMAAGEWKFIKQF